MAAGDWTLDEDKEYEIQSLLCFINTKNLVNAHQEKNCKTAEQNGISQFFERVSEYIIGLASFPQW